MVLYLHMIYTRMLSILKNNVFLIIVLVVGAFFRLYAIHDNNVFFFYDQSRDAVISRQIIEQGDIKIQGPSASGTNDSLYHGVLYYYLIGPLYTLFGGSPLVVSALLGILGTITIITVYKITYEITEDRVTAIISATLFSFSAHASLSATWLSNPQIALITIPLLYLYLWRLVKTKDVKNLPLIGLWLGLSHQSIIFSLYLFAPVLLVCAYTIMKVGIRKMITPLVITGAVYLASIGTMVLTQVQLWRNGIFKFEDVSGESKVNVTKSIDSITQVYTELLQWAIIPNAPMFSLIIASIVIIGALILSTKKQQFFICLWLLAPLTLLIFQPRNSGHTLMGVMPILYISFAIVLSWVKTFRFGYYVVGITIAGYLVSNSTAIQTVHQTARHPMVIQFGATLRHQLQAIDHTYSKNADFSIATLTVPYKVNTTWGYLYNWYGQKKYGKKPLFIGPNQAGLPGEDYLSYKTTPVQFHASIIEPLQGIPEFAQNEFKEVEEANSGPIVEEKKFKEIIVQYRQK